jgi:hypothetical protein
MSVGQLCDAGCTATFTATEFTINDSNNNIVVSGVRCPHRKLWIANLQPLATANTATQPPITTPLSTTDIATQPFVPTQFSPNNCTLRQRIAFQHASLFSPTLDTWTKAIKAGYLASFPSFTSKQIRKHPPQLLATTCGHMDQHRQGVQSTTSHRTITTTTSSSDPSRTHNLFATSYQTTGRTYSDQTGRFIVPSSRGHNYIFILYDYDSNFIQAVPLKTRAADEITTALKSTINMLKHKGMQPQLHIMDNETSQVVTSYLSTNNITLQLTPPHVHRRNAAERAIRTFKNHFLAGLSSTDPNFPLHLWDRILPQAIITLNLLRPSRLNPALSAYAQVHGAFNANATPLAPPGIRVKVHEKPTQRQSWASHSSDGWYIGPAMDHYRCHRVWITDTLAWFPSHIPMPFPSATDIIKSAITDIANVFNNPNAAPLLAALQQTERDALHQISNAFQPSNPTTNEIAPVNTSPLPRVSPTVLTNADAHDNTPPRPRMHTNRITCNDNNDATAKQITNSSHRHSRQRRHIQPIIRFIPGQANAVFLLPPSPSQITTFPPPSRVPMQYPYLPSANVVLDAETGAKLSFSSLVKGPDAPQWWNSAANEIGRLAQGIQPHMPHGTNTMFFIPHNQLPQGRTATYLRIVTDIKPHKKEKFRVRFTAGGDRINYPGDVSTPTADLVTAKLLFNSVISTADAKFMTIDIKDFYLNNPMERYEYMRINIKLIPPSIIQQYNLTPLVHNSHVLVEIRKGMYGLPQTGIIAHKRLVAHLLQHGYTKSTHTPGLFTHTTRPISFCLVVDDFGIKYIYKRDAHHLIQVLETLYKITVDWTGTKYIGLTLAWNYTQGFVDISMPGYVKRALLRFQHPQPLKPQHAPSKFTRPAYGQQQLTPIPDSSDILETDATRRLQEIIGVLLYYARAIDNTMLVALNALAISKTTKQTSLAAVHLLNYAATHPDATIRYKSSKMILHVHSDASYLSEPEARSRAGGYFFMGDGHDTSDHNGPIHAVCSVMKVVLASAAEAELGALFHNSKDAAWIRTILLTMGHPQPATPIQTDNACASGILNQTVKQRRSKAIDMRFYWIRDRIQQKHFNVYWRKGSDNLADYFTKHHSVSHHKQIRNKYLHSEQETTGKGVLLVPYPRYTIKYFTEQFPAFSSTEHHKPLQLNNGNSPNAESQASFIDNLHSS